MAEEKYKQDPLKGTLYNNRMKRKAEGTDVGSRLNRAIQGKGPVTGPDLNNPGKTTNYNINPATGVDQGRRKGRRRKQAATQDYYGIAKRKFLEPPTASGTTAKGKDGVTRTYDAATKTWKIQR